jgi:hypothetical protein
MHRRPSSVEELLGGSYVVMVRPDGSTRVLECSVMERLDARAKCFSPLNTP